MSVCKFIASDFPLAEFAPPKDYPLEINVDNSTINDGGADDNYFLNAFWVSRIMPIKNTELFLNGSTLRAEQNKLLNT